MKKVKKVLVSVIGAALIVSITVLNSGVAVQAKGHTEKGVVSWYRQNKKIKNGAAHKSIAFGTKVKVKNNSNGKTTTVVINDRGPYVNGRILDMNRDAFAKVANPSAGLFNGTITW